MTASPRSRWVRSPWILGISSTICRLTLASTVMPSACRSSAAPSITESPMARIGYGSGGTVVVG